MSDVLKGDSPPGEGEVHSHDEGATEETGQIQGQTTVHVERTGPSRLIPISETTARTVLAILDTITVKGSAGKFQVALAQQEIEKELANLSQPPSTSPNRAARRKERTKPRLVR